MNTVPFRDRLAVCSWSLQPNTPEELIAKLKEIGLPRIQLALDPLREKPQVWGNAGRTASREWIHHRFRNDRFRR
jgi:hypothetical protein